ncbi:MAG: hypothetical protein ACEQSR_12185 [Candidatus Methylacidiphilales bacterium]
MNALEFSTVIEHGQITLPDEYKSLENTLVRIIILSEKEFLKTNPKEKLKNAFKDLKNIKSFDKIENAIDWQKKVRDEWK